MKPVLKLGISTPSWDLQIFLPMIHLYAIQSLRNTVKSHVPMTLNVAERQTGKIRIATTNKNTVLSKTRQ
jgi:hypothetical protein